MPQSIPHHAHGASSARFGRLVRFSIASAVALAAAGMSTSAFAQPAPAVADGADVENSKFTTTGIIQSNAVFVRCGPGDNYYPTMKLDKGTKVKVVGARFDWLKVVPPEGSFCYVAKLYVDRHGVGQVGRVNKDSINVRAGSSLSALKIGILCELRQNEEVEIIGEEQEYFKIKPPAGAYLYVNKKFVEPDPEAKPEVQTAQNTKPATPKATVATTETPATGGTGAAPATGTSTAETIDKPTAPATAANTGTVATTGTVPDNVAKPGTPADATASTGTPATGTPATSGAATTETPATGAASTGTPATTAGTPAAGTETGSTGTTPASPDATATGTPAAGSAAAGTETMPPKTTVTDPATVATPKAPEVGPEQAFDQAEAEFHDARALPLEKQPIDDLLKKYEPLAKGDKLPESMRRVAEARVLTLKGRLTSQGDLLKMRKAQDELKQRQMALEAEQQELQQRIAANAVKFYAAVGTIQPSSLQQGQGTLYRVTDPATGRTVCYLRSNDKAAVSMLGQFVGIKGNLVDDARLGGRVIMATELVAVDPGKVHQTVTAQIIPPSLMPKEPTQAATDPR